MVQPTAFGRKLPHNDWEGDDFTPGAGGKYVTCMDTALGRNIAWATNGKVDLDGRKYRAALPGFPVGIDFNDAAIEARKVANKSLLAKYNWDSHQISSWLSHGNGLIIVGWYDALSRPFRYQAYGRFTHAMFVSHQSNASGMRLYDPLNPDTTAYGRWVPPKEIYNFVASWTGAVAYVPLEPL